MFRFLIFTKICECRNWSFLNLEQTISTKVYYPIVSFDVSHIKAKCFLWFNRFEIVGRSFFVLSESHVHLWIYFIFKRKSWTGLTEDSNSVIDQNSIRFYNQKKVLNYFYFDRVVINCDNVYFDILRYFTKLNSFRNVETNFVWFFYSFVWWVQWADRLTSKKYVTEERNQLNRELIFKYLRNVRVVTDANMMTVQTFDCGHKCYYPVNVSF